MGRPSLLTPERQKAIVAAIRAGSYDWVAAEANGVDRNTFLAWMRRGERERTEPFLSFRKDVLTARAQARLSAEIEVRRDSPFNWLRFGPGRERADGPGWTESKEIKHSGSVEIVQSAEWLRIAGALEAALRPFPEARLAVASALQNLCAGEDDPDEAEPVDDVLPNGVNCSAFLSATVATQAEPAPVRPHVRDAAHSGRTAAHAANDAGRFTHDRSAE